VKERAEKTKLMLRLQSVSTVAVFTGLIFLVGGLILLDVLSVKAAAKARVSWFVIAGGILLLAGLVGKVGAIRRAVMRRQTAMGANVLIMVTLAVLLYGLVLVISEHRFARVDVTLARRFNLSSTTLRFLRSIDKPVKITFLRSANDSFTMVMAQRINDLLSEYKAHSKWISVTSFDPLDPGSKEALDQLMFRIKNEKLRTNSVILEHLDRHKSVDYEDMIEMPQIPSPQAMPKFKGEEAFTAALISVIEGKEKRIYSITGHGERPLRGLSEADFGSGQRIDPYTSERFSFSVLAEKLKQDNYKLEQLDLMKEKAVPECAAILIAGPRTPFKDAELDILRDYISGGGRAIVMVDSKRFSQSETNIGELLADYGVTIRSDVFGCHRVGLVLGGKVIGASVEQGVSGIEMERHPVTTDLEAFGFAFSYSCALEIEPSAERPDIEVVPLLNSSESCWGETDLKADLRQAKYDEGVDIVGPFAVALAVQPRSPRRSPYQPPKPARDLPGPRLVVIAGSFDFTNAPLDRSPQNMYFVRNAVNWLAGKKEILGISPKSFEMNRATVTDSVKVAAKYIAMGLLPLAFVVSGVIVWLTRRKH